MDTELVEELRKTIDKLGSINELNEEDSKSLVDDLAVQYIADRNLVWWWEGLLDKPVVINYGDSLGWDYIVKLVRSPDQNVYLVATDDNAEPWEVFEGSLAAVVMLLENMWRFEYIIVDVNLSWIIFDTHHNSLVVAGCLREQAIELAAIES